MEGTRSSKLLIICILLVMSSGSWPLLRLPGAEARGPFCCPHMVDCNLVCQGFPNRCVDCMCICGGAKADHTHSSPPSTLLIASSELIN
ncbi:hypothetical protein REPUB_Repub01dG0033900 [Reevesia pubescens]